MIHHTLSPPLPAMARFITIVLLLAVSAASADAGYVYQGCYADSGNGPRDLPVFYCLSTDDASSSSDCSTGSVGGGI
jgi:hypothetical protein